MTFQLVKGAFLLGKAIYQLAGSSAPGANSAGNTAFSSDNSRTGGQASTDEDQFPDKLLSFDGEGDISTRQQLVFLVAAITSDLAYSNDPASDLLQNHHDIVERGLLQEIWKVDPAEAAGLTHRFVIGWSPSLQICFVGFRGTDNAEDVKADLGILQEGAAEWSDMLMHSGALQRAAGLPLGLIAKLMRSGPMVLTGHSLG